MVSVCVCVLRWPGRPLLRCQSSLHAPTAKGSLSLWLYRVCYSVELNRLNWLRHLHQTLLELASGAVFNVLWFLTVLHGMSCIVQCPAWISHELQLLQAEKYIFFCSYMENDAWSSYAAVHPIPKSEIEQVCILLRKNSYCLRVCVVHSTKVGNLVRVIL